MYELYVHYCDIDGLHKNNVYPMYTVKPVLRGHIWDKEKLSF